MNSTLRAGRTGSKQNRRGFAPLLLIVLAVVVVAAFGGGAVYFAGKGEDDIQKSSNLLEEALPQSEEGRVDKGGSEETVVEETDRIENNKKVSTPYLPGKNPEKCPDGIWDAAEQADPSLCPEDMPSLTREQAQISVDAYRNFVLNFDQSKVPQYKAKIFDEPKTLKFGRLIDIGGGLFPRVTKIGEHFYVFTADRSGYRAKVYDNDWEFTGVEKIVTPVGTQETDHDIASDGKYIYHYAMLPGEKGQIRKYDQGLSTVKQTPVFSAGPNDMILDQNIAVFGGKVYAGGEYRGEKRTWAKGQFGNIPPNPVVDRGLHIRIYDTDLNLLGERDLIADLKNAVVPNQFWGLGISQLYAEGYHALVVHSPIGNVRKFPKGESIGGRQIFIARFNQDYGFVDSYGPLSDTDADNFWPTASWYEDGKYFFVYVAVTEGYGPGPGEPVDPNVPHEENLRLGIYDKNFQEIETVNLLEKGKGAGLPGMIKVGNRLYISYMKMEGGAAIREIILN